eukprot:3399964-Prymnesium_polylepis.1
MRRCSMKLRLITSWLLAGARARARHCRREDEAASHHKLVAANDIPQAWQSPISWYTDTPTLLAHHDIYLASATITARARASTRHLLVTWRMKLQ